MADKIEVGIPTSEMPWGMITKNEQGQVVVYRFTTKKLCKMMYEDFKKSVGMVYTDVARVKWSAGVWSSMEADDAVEAEVIEGEYIE